MTAEDQHRQYLRQEYMGRINRVIYHFESNLDGNLKLYTLEGVANFFPLSLSPNFQRHRWRNPQSVYPANPS